MQPATNFFKFLHPNWMSRALSIAPNGCAWPPPMRSPTSLPCHTSVMQPWLPHVRVVL
jgi:hypothetical protein